MRNEERPGAGASKRARAAAQRPHYRIIVRTPDRCHPLREETRNVLVLFATKFRGMWRVRRRQELPHHGTERLARCVECSLRIEHGHWGAQL